jgi:histidine triad (HIT) family protein
MSNASALLPGADPGCIFCKIVAGHIPSSKVFEDEHVFAFHDIAPWAPVHFLIIPKLHIATLYDAAGDEQRGLLGHMLSLAPRLALQLGVTNGFRSVINTGPDGRQEVGHLHLHVMGGPRPWQKG